MPRFFRRRRSESPQTAGAAEIAGVACAVGLDWFLPRNGATGRWAWARYARELDYGLLAVRRGEYAQAAFGSASAGHRPGLRAAAGAAAAAAPPGMRTWQGLLPLGDGRLLHIVADRGLVLPEVGDAVRASEREAVAEFEALRAERIWDALYAPSELGIPGTEPFPEDRLRHGLRVAPRLREAATVPRPLRYLIPVAAFGVAMWFLAPTVMEWIRPAPPPPPETPPPPPEPPPGIDSQAFLRGCADARLRAEIPLPGWQRAETACGDGLSSRGLIGSADGTLLVRWSHRRPTVAHLRRIAERRLAAMRGARGLVDEREAFGAAAVDGYRVERMVPGADLKALRREVDERLGPIAETLTLALAAQPGMVPANTVPFEEWRVQMTTAHPISELLARPVPHLEWLRIDWPAGEALRAEGRIRIGLPLPAVAAGAGATETVQ